MSTWVSYKGLQLPDPDPTGDAGANLKTNFEVLVDRGLQPAAGVGGVAFVGAGPVLVEDSSNLFWDATEDRLGIGTDEPDTSLDVRGAVTLGEPVGTLSNPDSGQVVLFVNDNSGTIELKARFPDGTEKVIADDS